ncbi:MAG: phospholipase [Bacteroidetes bacterium]|nr:MAG: phospholipase [Bacteroidota bacterium]
MEKKIISLEHVFKPASIASSSEKYSAGKPEKTPAIIMLHGFGSDENDLFSFASELPDKYFIISLKAPIAMQPYGNAWYNIYFDGGNGKFSDDEQAIQSRDLIVKCIDEIILAYNIDPEKITLLGFSQGTILGMAVALSYPEKIKNVIALSGYINEKILVEGYEEHDFSGLNFYSSHGSDDQVIPVEWGRKTKPFLSKLGIDCHYSEFPVGHGVSPQNFYEFKQWLSEVDE